MAFRRGRGRRSFRGKGRFKRRGRSGARRLRIGRRM